MLLKSNDTGCIHIQIYAQVHILNYVVFYTDIANTIRDIVEVIETWTTIISSSEKPTCNSLREFQHLVCPICILVRISPQAPAEFLW